MHPASPAVLAFLVVACSTPPPTESRRNGEAVEVLAFGEPFATVHTGAMPRPYVWPLFAAGQIPVTRAFPMAERQGEQQDHPHHQSLWIAHGDVDGFDFWHGKEHEARIELVDCKVWGSTEVVVECDYIWRAADRDVLLESRTLRFAAEDDVRMVTITSTFRAPGQLPVRFGDTKEGTFAMRVHPGLQVRGEGAAGTLRNSETATGTGVWGKRARWIWATGVVDDKPVSVGFFDHPENPRSPTRWHARDYGLLAANPFGEREFARASEDAGGLVLQPGHQLEFRYAILMLPGAHDDPKIAETMWQTWRSHRAR